MDRFNDCPQNIVWGTANDHAAWSARAWRPRRTALGAMEKAWEVELRAVPDQKPFFGRGDAVSRCTYAANRQSSQVVGFRAVLTFADGGPGE